MNRIKINNVWTTTKNLEGKKWSDLSKESQEKLLLIARAWNTKEPGKCIIDFENLEFSIAGYIEVRKDENEIIIDNNAIFYDPTK
jgi:hypothetical protein